MQVEVHVQFASPSEDDWADMESLGQCVTNSARSVRVSAVEGRAGWLVVEFTMPTEAQYNAVEEIDRALRLYGGNRLDSAIGFPRSEAEQARCQRKAERRRARRRASSEDSLAKETRP
jgi:hypothetical protein